MMNSCEPVGILWIPRHTKFLFVNAYLVLLLCAQSTACGWSFAYLFSGRMRGYSLCKYWFYLLHIGAISQCITKGWSTPSGGIGFWDCPGTYTIFMGISAMASPPICLVLAAVGLSARYHAAESRVIVPDLHCPRRAAAGCLVPELTLAMVIYPMTAELRRRLLFPAQGPLLLSGLAMRLSLQSRSHSCRGRSR